MLGKVLGDVEPYNHPAHIVHLLFFKCFAESQYEYCRTLRALHDANCLQGAIPVLRSLVEVSVAQLLFQRDQDYSELFEVLAGERVKTGDAHKKIGWPETQSDIYALLSRMTHPSRTSAFLGRTLDFESEPLKSLTGSKSREDIAKIAHVMLWTAAREDEAARQERWGFMALHTFELAISSLFTLYGKDAPNSHWWPGAEIHSFEALAEEHPNIKDHLLWYWYPWEHSKQSDMDRLTEALDGVDLGGQGED